MIFIEDKGLEFGEWDDNTSKLMYYLSTPLFLSMVNTCGKVYDLGGGNGIIKKFISHAITVDIDESKKPDILEDIRAFVVPDDCNLVIIRYVFHYLTDNEIKQLISNIKCPCLIIQFVNNSQHSLFIKKEIARQAGENKYFRTEPDLFGLLPYPKNKLTIAYRVDPEFYLNRLNVIVGESHDEEIIGLYYESFPS